jgi:phage terminase large subunit GpA-like protein
MDFAPLDFAELGVQDGSELARRAIAQALLPPPDLDIPEWAERVRHLPRGTRFAGQWRNQRAPYLVEPMRALSPSSTVQYVVLMFGSQVGKTEVLLNAIGHALDVRPAVVLVVLPSEKQVRKWSRVRLDPLIHDSPGLRARVTEKQRERGNSILLKASTNGTILSLVGANNGNDLRSTPARMVLGDEIDGWPAEVRGEGDPVQLALRATMTFEGVKKVGLVSTPTIKGRSRIADEWSWTDRCVFLVPCPYCEFRQVIAWNPRKEVPWPQSRMEWDRGDYTSVRMVCAQCSRGIEEGAKHEMLAGGEWRAERPELSEYKRGFWL